jgi:hypothetical protein
MHACHDPVVERVHGAPASVGANYIHYEFLDIRSLYFHIDTRASPDQRQDFVQCGYRLDPGVHFRQLGSAEGGDGLRRSVATCQFPIMMHDQVAVAGGVDVELDAVHAELQGALEARQRVFGVFGWRAAMGYYFRASHSVLSGAGAETPRRLRAKLRSETDFRQPSLTSRVTARLMAWNPNG